MNADQYIAAWFQSSPETWVLQNVTATLAAAAACRLVLHILRVGRG